MAKAKKKVKKLLKNKKIREPKKKLSWLFGVLLVLLLIYLFSIGTSLWILAIIIVLLILVLK